MDIFAAACPRRAKVARQRTCPIGDLIGADMESPYLEQVDAAMDIKQQAKGKILKTPSSKRSPGSLTPASAARCSLVSPMTDHLRHEDDYATFSKRGQVGDQDLGRRTRTSSRPPR